jgi:hypothetical protein
MHCYCFTIGNCTVLHSFTLISCLLYLLCHSRLCDFFILTCFIFNCQLTHVEFVKHVCLCVCVQQNKPQRKLIPCCSMIRRAAEGQLCRTNFRYFQTASQRKVSMGILRIDLITQQIKLVSTCQQMVSDFPSLIFHVL